MNHAEQFEIEGVIERLPAFTPEQVGAAMKELTRLQEAYPVLRPNGVQEYGVERYWDEVGSSLPWFKGLHECSPLLVELALSERLAKAVTEILGEGASLWSAQFLQKKSNQSHRWHADIETLSWHSVNIWIALENVSADATLKVIPKTHHTKEIPQSIDGLSQDDLLLDDAVLKHAMRMGGMGAVMKPDLKPGEAIVFNGRCWHASDNHSHKTRTALLLQYTAQTDRVRIPTTFTPPIKWHPRAPLTIPVPC